MYLDGCNFSALLNFLKDLFFKKKKNKRFIFHSAQCVACGILVPGPGIEPCTHCSENEKP